MLKLKDPLKLEEKIIVNIFYTLLVKYFNFFHLHCKVYCKLS